MSDRRKMQFGDWLSGAAMLAMGIFLGLAVGEWVKLDGAAFWLTIIYVFIPFGFVFLFIFFMTDLLDRFNGAVKPAAVRRWEKRKPLALLFFLPAGVLMGTIGAQFGLSEILLQGL